MRWSCVWLLALPPLAMWSLVIFSTIWASINGSFYHSRGRNIKRDGTWSRRVTKKAEPKWASGMKEAHPGRSSRLGFLVLVCFPEECVFPKYPTLEPCLAVGVDLHPCSRQEKHPSHQTATCAPPFISHPWLDLQQEQKHFQYEQNGGNTRRTLTIKFQAIFISRCSFGKVIFPPVPIRR